MPRPGLSHFHCVSLCSPPPLRLLCSSLSLSLCVCDVAVASSLCSSCIPAINQIVTSLSLHTCRFSSSALLYFSPSSLHIQCQIMASVTADHPACLLNCLSANLCTAQAARSSTLPSWSWQFLLPSCPMPSPAIPSHLSTSQ